MQPLVSVIIPSYNRPLLLKMRSIPSVLAQTHANWEILVIGDGPEDDSLRCVVEGFGDSRIQYAEIPRPDYSTLTEEERWHVAGAAARNRGLELARGEIIAPLDDDDQFLPNHLADSVEALVHGDHDFTYGYVWIRDIETGKDYEDDWLSWSDATTRELFLQRNIIYHSSVAYLRSYAKIPYPTDGTFPADYALWLAIYEAGARFTNLSKPQAVYYGDSLTASIRVSVPSLPPYDALNNRFAEIYRSRMLSNAGPICTEFEAKVAEYLDIPGVVSTPSGDIGLILAIQALRLLRADERRSLILPSYAHPSLVNAALWNGFEPCFCDIDPHSLCITPETVEPCIGRDTAIIAPLHAHGNPCDMPILEQLARFYGIVLLADAAAAFGAQVGGVRIGGWGDIEVFSLSGTKLLTAGEGGLICSRNMDLLALARRLGRYGIGEDYLAETPGVNGKLAELPAALALEGLSYVDQWLERRRQAEAFYRSRLSELPGLRFLGLASETAVSSCKDAVLILSCPEDAQALRRHLKAYRIESRPYYRPLHRMPAYACFRRGDLTATEAIADCTLCVPLYNEIRNDVLELTADVICEALR